MNRCFPAAMLVACVTVAPLAAEQQDVASEALIGLARVKRDARDMAAARRYFEEASRRVPLTLEQRTEYFWILSELEPRAALAVGRGILHEQPGSEAVRDRVITSALAAGDESTVVAVAIDGRRLEPETARWARRLAESYLRTKNYSGAVTAYRAAADAQDANDSDRAGLAFALEGAGDHAQAAEAWRAVPSGLRAARPDWMASYLRSRAMAGAAAEAAPEIQSWLERHPDDLRMRALLVELWARDGRPDRALALLDPLRSGPDATPWIRREAALARAAGERTRAIRALESLLRSGHATSAERWDLAELLTEVGDTARAAELSRMISRSVQSCDERLFTMMDRLPDPVGTDLLLEGVSGRRCDTRPHWLERAIARAVAAGRHQEALTALAELPYERANQAIRRLEGQLRLWTGDPAGAIRPLQDAVAGDPDDGLAREALVDAYRATGRGYAAWEAAEPLLQLSSLSPHRLTLVAELALDADRPEIVIALGDRLAEASVSGETRASLEARALLAEGRPGAAVRLLQPFDAASLAPAAALALLDGLIAMGGHASAAATAARVASETADWKDVLARRLVIATMAGDEKDAGRIRSALQRVDPVTAVFADADAALAAGRPLDALAAVDRLGAGEQPARQADIRATVLTLTGRLAEAAEIVGHLRAARPRSLPLAIREADLAWRVNPTDESLSRLIALAATAPANQHAAIVAAGALSSVGRLESVVGILERASAGGDLPLEGAVKAAEALHALGRTEAALGMLTRLDPLPPAAATLRAELTVAVRGLAVGVPMFRSLAARRDASPAIFTRWAALLPTPAEQRIVLEEAGERFPENAGVLARLAVSRLACGDPAGAAMAASEATRVDPNATEAWFTLITAAAATRPPADVSELLRQFTAASTGKPSVLIGMAEHVAGLVRAPGDPLLRAAEAMLDATAGDAAVADASDVARARVFAAADRWQDALEAIDAVLGRDGRSRAALRLRADVLSWAGRHAAAIEALDAYLLVAPGDTDVLRQKARVMGWNGEHTESLRLYDALLAVAPDDAGLAAEAVAKRAFYGARWPLAVGAYDAWLTLDPGSSEARFELAEALRAAGELARADSTLFELSAATGHRLAAAARERALYNRRPSVTLSRASREADGYGAARLLELREETGAFAVTLGHHGATTLQVDGARMQANGDHVRRYGSRGGVRIATPLSPEFLLSGHASVWHFSGGDLSAAGEARVEWRVAQIWKATLGLERELVLENEATVDSRLAATGILAGARAETRNGALEFRAAWQNLSDGNTRRRISLQVNRSLGGRPQRFRVLGRAEELAYTKAAGAYFSPPDLLRVDAGVEYAHPLTRSRFRGDRHGEIALGYLAGTDNRGVIYHQPTARFAVEVGGGVAIDGRAAWIQSAVYDHQTLSIGVRLGGGAGAR